MSKARDIADLGSNDVLETTATGVDVTGTVTADGLAVDTGGTAVILNHSATGPTLRFNNLDQTVADGQQLARIEFSTDDGGSTTDEAYLQLTATGGGGAADFDIMTGDGTPVRRARFGVGGDVSFYEDTGTTAKMVWDASAESLGIGTASPSSPLTISGGNGLEPVIKASDGGANGYTMLADNYTSTDSQVNLGIKYGSASAVLSWGVKPSNTTDTYVSSTGLYSKSPQAIEMNTNGIRFLQGASATVATDLAVAMSERARIDSSGNLLVGTTSGNFSAKMVVENTASYTFLSRRTGTGSEGHLVFQNANGAVGTIFTNGSTTSYNTSSDERLKENIRDTTHTVDINDIQVREFDWKADGSHQRFGFIAQELETVYPEAVHSPEDADEMKSVDYSKLVPLLVKEIQTLKTRIETLENK